MAKLITTEDLNKIKESNIESMKINFKRDGNLFPVVMIIAPDGGMTIIGTPYTSNKQKTKMMNEVKDMCKKIDAISVIIINEAWMKSVKKEDYDKYVNEMKVTGKRVSDYSDKKECAIVIFETKFTNECVTFDIDRTNNELINRNSQMLAGGDFANILCPVIQKN